MDIAQKKLDAAVARRVKIAELLIPARAAVEADKEATKGIRGAPTLPRKNKTAALKAAVARLENDLLPGEHREVQARPAGFLAASARANAQHHADAETVPAGRLRDAAASQDHHGAAAAAAGDGAAAAAADVDDDALDDDDEEDPNFPHYYRVSSNQRKFNSASAKAYRKGELNRKVTRVVPPKVLPNACLPEIVGLGAFHMHAPHLEMGLPLPPCPRCGWKSVDKQMVTSRGLCPARRVYAPEVDEWLGGFSLRCGICYQNKEELKSRLEELDEDEDAGEYEEVEAAIKAAMYCYRSYNPTSIQIYAERYAWWVESLEYVVLNKRTAVTRLLARRIMRACTKGSNPTDLAEELLELKAEMFNSLQAQVSTTEPSVLALTALLSCPFHSSTFSSSLHLK
jgi:hypothetical protein